MDKNGNFAVFGQKLCNLYMCRKNLNFFVQIDKRRFSQTGAYTENSAGVQPARWVKIIYPPGKKHGASTKYRGESPRI